MTSQLYYLSLWHKYFYCTTVDSIGILSTSKSWFSLGRWEIGLLRTRKAEATEKSIHEWIRPRLWLPLLQHRGGLRPPVRTVIYPLPVKVKVQLSNFSFVFFIPSLLFFFQFYAFFNWGRADWQYYVSFRCTTQWFTNFKGYSPFILITKYWLYSLCCSVYPCGLLVY